MRREAVLAGFVAAALGIAPGLAVAGQSGARIDLLPSGLSVQAPAAVELPAVHLSGSPVTVQANAGPIRVVDTRAGSPGWTLVATAGVPSDALGRPMSARLVAVPAAASIPAGIRLGDPQPLDAPRALAQADPGSGTGAWVLDPGLRLTVPADAASGVYSTTLVVTIS